MITNIGHILQTSRPSAAPGHPAATAQCVVTRSKDNTVRLLPSPSQYLQHSEVLTHTHLRSILQFQSSLAPRWRLLDVVAMKISVDVETSCLVYRDQDQDRRPGSWSIAVTLATSGQQPAASQSRIVLCSAPSVPQPVVQSRRRHYAIPWGQRLFSIVS